MNRSGEAVGALVSYYHVALDRLLVVVDDADLPLGELRLRPQGSSAGHHGLESIEQQLGSRRYARLRIGIGRSPEAQRAIADYVLRRFADTRLSGWIGSWTGCRPGDVLVDGRHRPGDEPV